MKEKNTITAMLGGGMKPPHSGHFDIVKETLNKYPEINNFKILIGSGIRNNITQEMSFKIWEIYKKYLPNNIILENSVSPIGDIKRYAKNNPTEDIYFVLGARKNNNSDLIDIKARTKDLHKYPNIEVKIIETNNPTQGKLLRENLNNISPFLPIILSESDKINIQNILKEITSDEVKYWALYAHLFNRLEKSNDPKAEYEDLKNKLGGEKLKALDYFYNEFFTSGVSSLNENATYSQDIDYKQHIKDLSKYYLTKYPNLKTLPKVKFIHGNKENARHLHTKTGYYDPNTKTIVIYTEGRHPRDIISTFSHELYHWVQDLEGRLDNIKTTNTQEDDYLNNIEKEAYLEGNINFRNWKDLLKNNPEYDSYYKKYEQYAITELFEKDLPNIEKVNNIKYIAGNGDNIEAEYIFKPTQSGEDGWEIYWKFTDNNKNSSPEAWKQVTTTSYKILKDFIDNNNPKYIEILGNSNSKNEIYQSKPFLEKLEKIFNNKYKTIIDEYAVYLRRIDEISQSSIKKRMETLNESYEQSLNYWKNGDLNSKSKIERWKSVKKLIERHIISEICGINKTNIKDSKDPYGLNAYAIELAKGLEEEMNEGKQVGNLYHYTLGVYLYDIIKSNTLYASSLTSFDKDDKPVNSISFTRDSTFHYKRRKIMGTDARIQLDGNKLSQKYKILPYADKDFRTIDSKESEERITFPSGDDEGIKNLEQYVISYDVFLKRIRAEDLIDLIDLFNKKNYPISTNLKTNNPPGQPVVRYYLNNESLLDENEIMEIYNKVKKKENV